MSFIYQTVEYILNNRIESIAAVFSILTRVGLSYKWKYTPLIMLVSSLMWAIFGLITGHMGLFVLQTILSVQSLFNQFKWCRE
jgi:hypothetical protein